MYKNLAALASIVMIVGGCSASGNVEIAKAKSEPIRPNSTVALSLDAADGVSDPDSTERALKDVRSSLYANLPGSGIFSTVVPDGQPADYQMSVDLSDVRVVSGGTRFVAGAFAGGDVVGADVTLIDASNGLEITSFKAVGESAAHPYSSETGFDSAVRSFTDQVTQTLR